MALKRKAKKYNPVAMLTNAARKIWLWSPMRKEALKRAGNCCEECGSTEGLQVHHRNEAEVYPMMQKVAEKLFPPASELDVLCKECHKLAHRKDK